VSEDETPQAAILRGRSETSRTIRAGDIYRSPDDTPLPPPTPRPLSASDRLTAAVMRLAADLIHDGSADSEPIEG